MIEVEKRFQLTDEQEKAMLEGAEFLGEKLVHDIYYDYPDYRMMKKDIRLRKRNDKFELKVKKSAGVNQEIENEKEIARYFNLSDSISDFVEKNLVKLIEYNTLRKKYKKGDFNIDIDNTDFNYKLCEIELLVDKDSDVKSATTQIKELAQKFGFENQKTLPKRVAFLKKFKIEVYNELYGNKNTG
ncbi:MAG: CYTH domain-containing protein [Patescibacteria group bacterium]